MMDQDDWNSRVIKITFVNEAKGNDVKVRKFDRLSQNAGKDQINQFAEAVSALTPNGADGNLTADVYEHYLFFDNHDVDES